MDDGTDLPNLTIYAEIIILAVIVVVPPQKEERQLAGN